MKIVNVIKPPKNITKYIHHIVYGVIILSLVFCIWFMSYNKFNIDNYNKVEDYTSFSYNLNAVISISEQSEQTQEETSLKSMYVSSTGYLDLLNEKHTSNDTYNINSFPYIIESYSNKNISYYYAPSFINKYIIKDNIHSFNGYISNSIFQTKTFPGNSFSSVKMHNSIDEDIIINDEVLSCKKIDLSLSDPDQLGVVKNYISLLSQKSVFFDLEKTLSTLKNIDINSFNLSLFENNEDIRKIELSTFLNTTGKIISVYYSIEFYNINKTTVVDFPVLNETNSVNESSILQAVG